MTLDREATRALFGEATAAAGAPYATQTATPVTANSAFERMNGRKGVDWRLVAPVGVAVVCIGAIALFALPRGDRAVEGRTVAATELVAPPLAPTSALMESAVVAPPAIVTPQPAATPVAQRAATRPAAVRRTPARTVAAAPSAAETGVNVSATEPAAPPAPTLGAPAVIELRPALPVAPPPFVEPAPMPMPMPQF